MFFDEISDMFGSILSLFTATAVDSYHFESRMWCKIIIETVVGIYCKIYDYKETVVNIRQGHRTDRPIKDVERSDLYLDAW